MDVEFFLAYITMGIGWHIFGQGYQALGANPKESIFSSNFVWKLSWNVSLQEPLIGFLIFLVLKLLLKSQTIGFSAKSHKMCTWPNAITHQPIELQSCSNPQNTQSVFRLTLRAGWFWGFSAKKTPKRTWLCAWISPLLFALATRRMSQKRIQSSIVLPNQWVAKLFQVGREAFLNVTVFY